MELRGVGGIGVAREGGMRRKEAGGSFEWLESNNTCFRTPSQSTL